MTALYLLLAAIAPVPTTPPDAGEDLWFELPHGSFPRITKQAVEGKLPKTGDDAAASFTVQEREWQVTVEREGRAPIRLRVGSERRGGVHLERALLWASGDEQELRLKVPYGDPQYECFANGKDVFAAVYLIVPQQGSPEVHESRFEDCKAQTERLVAAEQNGWLVVAN